MITVYCRHCYADNPEEAQTCRVCSEPMTTGDDESFVEGLIWALRHPEPTVAPRAARILGQLREPSAVAPLIELAERSTDLGALEEVATALGNIGDPAAVPALARLARESYLPVRVRAVEALGRIGGVDAQYALNEAASDPCEAVRAAAVAARDRSTARKSAA